MNVNQQLLSYIESLLSVSDVGASVSVGSRESVSSFPCIFIDVTNCAQSDAFGVPQDGQLNVTLTAMVRDYEKGSKALYLFEDKIKKALSADRTLGGFADQLLFSTTTYFKEFPALGLTMNVSVLYSDTFEFIELLLENLSYLLSEDGDKVLAG